MNIIDFAARKLPIQLSPVQTFALKVAYGLPLNAWAKDIVLRDAAGKVSWQMSEAEYLRFLYLAGRSNVYEVVPGHEHMDVGLVTGRRSGKGVLGQVMMAYETWRLVEDAGHVNDVCGPHAIGQGATIRPTAIFTNQDQSEIWSQDYEGLTRPASLHPAVRVLKGRMPCVMGGSGAKVEAVFASHARKTFRGSYVPFALLDEAAHFGARSVLGLSEELGALPTWKLAVLTSGHPKGGDFNVWWRKSWKDGLRLRIPTWEMNPDIPLPDFQKVLDQRGQEVFDYEYGAAL